MNKYKIIERYDNIVKDEFFKGYLSAIYDSRTSFYKKARVYKKYDSIVKANLLYLVSYNTIVAIIDLDKNTPYIYGWYSQTTARHINEFLKQNGFQAMTKKEMIKD